jgi:hypothetical protein
MMRRTRRFRKWRRPKRFDNRLKRKKRIPPSTRSRWEAKARIIAQLKKVLPLTDVIVEDIQVAARPGKKRKWNADFSPVQVGKEHLYVLLRAMGLTLHTRQGWQTQQLREQYGLKKTKSKSKPRFESHCVDAWALAASISGASHPRCKRVVYIRPVILHRRQLHRLEASKGGRRTPYGSTRSLGLKRGTLVRHPKYGLCSVGGYNTRQGTISLCEYRTNKRLTQSAKVADCQIKTAVTFRSWLISAHKKKGSTGISPSP